MGALNDQIKKHSRAIPEIAFCEQKQSLLASFSEAAYQLTMLHREKSDAVMADNPNAGCYDEIIDRARQAKDYAKYAYLHHVIQHGCGVFEEHGGGPDAALYARN